MIPEMGLIVGQKSVKMVVSMIFRDEESRASAENSLKRKFGAIEPFEKIFVFDYTDYYEKEFGKQLKRKLICFKRLVSREGMSRIKVISNKIEDRLRKNGKRTVNIDPGYVNDAKLVLLTTKDYTHRIYVGDGIFAESTLFFQDGTFRGWPWTYPDYRSEDMISYFNDVRNIYMKDIKKAKT